ncbi:hypothetical protein TBR22_A32970 [Luteitalea sp. TBR-22]|nr:hypothetical protein TBR22_A32970 [Luteitalea sp. TBR-22]
MRVPADQLGAHRLERRLDVEAAGVLADLRQEHALEQQVADLLAQAVGVLPLDGVDHLGGLLEHVAREAAQRLFAVPRAAVGPAQAGHDFDEPREGRAGSGRRRRRQGPYASIRK